MCLAVPFRIEKIEGDHAVVESGGLRRRVVVAFVPEPAIGDHVLVHAGFAIRKWTDADLAEYNQIVRTTAGPRNAELAQ